MRRAAALPPGAPRANVQGRVWGCTPSAGQVARAWPRATRRATPAAQPSYITLPLSCCPPALPDHA
ncbi:hypothetical protein EON67_12030 [archaeon]|nr:MAG: hypothetical protein EON67_12030 [archaeon]